MVTFIYIILNFVMYYFLYIAGKRMVKLKTVTIKNLWKATWIGVVAFTLNEGLRFGRGLDYNIYANLFNLDNATIASHLDFGFASICTLLKQAHMSFQVLVMIMSFTLISSIVIFTSNFKECAKYALPAFAMLYYAPTENLMRWYFALSFIFIGFSYFIKLNQDKKGYTILCIFSVISFYIHYAAVLVPIMYVLIARINKPFLKPWTAIIIYFVVGLFFSTKYMMIFADYVNIFSILSDNAIKYIENSEKWLTSGATGTTAPAFRSLSYTLMACASVLVAYKVTLFINSHKIIIIYNLTCIGFILAPIGNQIEFAYRFQEAFYIFQYIIWGYFILYYKRKQAFSKYLRICTLLILLNFGRTQIQIWLEEPEYTKLYVWDSKGRDFLNLSDTYYKDFKIN